HASTDVHPVTACLQLRIGNQVARGLQWTEAEIARERQLEQLRLGVTQQELADSLHREVDYLERDSMTQQVGNQTAPVAIAELLVEPALLVEHLHDVFHHGQSAGGQRQRDIAVGAGPHHGQTAE